MGKFILQAIRIRAVESQFHSDFQKWRFQKQSSLFSLVNVFVVKQPGNTLLVSVVLLKKITKNPVQNQSSVTTDNGANDKVA